MLRDNRGRFIKKAVGGTSLVSPTARTVIIGGKQRELLPEAEQAFAAYQKNNGMGMTLESWVQTSEGSKYLKPLESDTMIVSGVAIPTSDESSQDVVAEQQTQTSPIKTTFNPLTTTRFKPLESPTIAPSQNFRQTHPQNSIADLLKGNGAKEKIKYYYKNGRRVDEFGNPIDDSFYFANKDNYQVTLPTDETNNAVSDFDPSAGMTIFKDKVREKTDITNINRERIADFLDFTRAGIGTSINNKIAERALKAEKPLLQDVSESYRNVYGDYSAVVQGEKAAAKLRNLASKPLTSDGALQQQMQLEAQIQGQQHIDQGKAADNELTRQTRETAWQQAKEDRLQRQAVAMQNRQAMLMSEKNEEQTKNMRDSANYSQIIAPLSMGIEKRLRAYAAEQKQYQEYFDKQAIHNNVWTSYDTGLTSEQIELRDLYNSGGYTAIDEVLTKDPNKRADWNAVLKILGDEEARRFAALKGVTYRTSAGSEGASDRYGYFAGNTGYGIFSKKGGTIYKARLTKRTRDNDRASRSIESSKKIAARFLEKAMDSLYTYDQVELIAKPSKKKRKYQAGGALPFVSYTPVFATSETGASATYTPSSKKKSGDDEEGLISKDIKELISSLDPLPIDMLMIERELVNFENLSALSPTGEVPSSVLTSRYFNILSKIKIAKFNREEYTQALNQLKGNGGLNEFAVTSDGRLIGTNKDGDFEYFTPDQVNAGDPARDGYVLITNSNLLHLRANSPEGAFDHQLITFAQGGIGMEAITKIVNDAVQSLGKSEKEESGFVQIGSEGSIKAGLQFLQKAVQEVGDPSVVHTMSVADYYQAGYLTEDQAQQANLALQYIMNTLPANARALLQVKGGSPEGGMALLSSIITAKTSTKTQFKATPKKMTNTGSGGSGSSSGDVDGLKLSPVQMMQLGYTDHTEITLQKGTKYAVKVNAQVLPIYDVNKEGLGVTTLDKVASSSFGGALDMNNVTMGGQLIDPHSMQNVQIDATNLYVMNLPIDKNSPDGTIKPDLAWLQKIEAIDQTIREQGITDIATINALYTEAGLPVLMDDNGQLNTRDYCKFGVLNGHALNTAFKDLDVLDDTMLEIEDEDQIENVMRIINAGKSEKDRIDFDSKGFWDFLPFTEHDSLFEGTVYIPIRTNPFTGMMGGGQYPTVETAAEVEALVQQKERTRGYVDPGLLTE